MKTKEEIYNEAIKDVLKLFEDFWRDSFETYKDMEDLEDKIRELMQE
jgi:hypothetical protein